MITKHAAFAAALVTLAGCPKLFEVEVELGEVCLTRRGVEVPGVPAGAPPTAADDFTFDDLGAIHELMDKGGADLKFVRAELRSEIALDFMQSAHLSISSGDPNSTLDTLQVLNCEDCLADGSTLGIPAGVQSNAIEYLEGESIIVDMEVAGTMPSEDWKMDVDLCMAGHFSVAP